MSGRDNVGSINHTCRFGDQGTRLDTSSHIKKIVDFIELRRVSTLEDCIESINVKRTLNLCLCIGLGRRRCDPRGSEKLIFVIS